MYLQWEKIPSDHKWMTTFRAKLPGGWLIFNVCMTTGSNEYGGLTFYPDPEYKWDISKNTMELEGE